MHFVNMLFLLNFALPVFICASQGSSKDVKIKNSATQTTFCHNPYANVLSIYQDSSIQEFEEKTFPSMKNVCSCCYYSGPNIIQAVANGEKLINIERNERERIARNERERVRNLFSVLRRLIQAFGFSSSKQERNKKEARIIQLLKSSSMETWNKINPETGQSLAHEIIPLAWNTPFVQMLVDMGMDINVQTTAPDRFVGSTLLHGVAGTVKSKRDMGYDMSAQQYIQTLLVLCRHCPSVLRMKSFGGHNTTLKMPLDLLLCGDRREILDQLRQRPR